MSASLVYKWIVTAVLDRPLSQISHYGAAIGRPPPTRPASPASCTIPACPLPVPTGEDSGQDQPKRKIITFAGNAA